MQCIPYACQWAGEDGVCHAPSSIRADCAQHGHSLQTLYEMLSDLNGGRGPTPPEIVRGVTQTYFEAFAEAEGSVTLLPRLRELEEDMRVLSSSYPHLQWLRIFTQ